MAAQTKLNLASNEPQEMLLPGGMFGAQQIVLTFHDNPSAGTAAVEVMPVGGAEWVTLEKAIDLPLTGAPFFIRSAGWINRVRVTLTGAVGGIDGWLWAEQVNEPQGLYEGTAAQTVQSYTEANVKKGAQFSASTYLTGLTAGEIIDIIVVTGAEKVIIKGQYIELRDSGDVLTEWFKSPTYSGGANISAGIYNQSDVNRLPSTVQLFGVTATNPAGGNYTPNDADKVAVTSVGTKIAPTMAALGIIGQGSASSSRAATEGLEAVLDANSTYLFRRTCRSATASLFGFSTWFEGEPDLPL